MRPSPEEEELDLGVLKRGEVWRHRRTGREAQIIVEPHAPWTIVEYRYLTESEEDEVIRTQRNGRWSKWHKATTWASNDAFWITACGMSVFKRSSVTEHRDALQDDHVCRRCGESLQSDGSVTTVRFASVQVEVDGDSETVANTMADVGRLLGAAMGK